MATPSGPCIACGAYDGDHDAGCSLATTGFTIYAANRGGDTWTVATCSHADDAQRVLDCLRRAKVYQYVGCYETDNPEGGDVEPVEVSA